MPDPFFAVQCAGFPAVQAEKKGALNFGEVLTLTSYTLG